MDRQNFMLAVMAAQDNQIGFLPVHVQKVFFILDKEASGGTGGPYFSFKPYDYGPFDKDVYNELSSLAAKGLIEIDNSRQPRRYLLTSQGYTIGKNNLDILFSNDISKFIADIVNWVSALSFEELVATIYTHYPETKENSIFR
jgi:uncharacterized protein